jgi:hypothetical protein
VFSRAILIARGLALLFDVDLDRYAALRVRTSALCGSIEKRIRA